MFAMPTAYVTRHSTTAELLSAVGGLLHGPRWGRSLAREVGLSHGLVAGVAAGARDVTAPTGHALGAYAREQLAVEAVRHRERVRVLALLSDRYP